jgi:hypothetical protein
LVFLSPSGEVFRPSAVPVGAVSSIDPLMLYAAAIDTSDYVAHIAPLIRQFVPFIGRLLDVGAGGGQLGHALGASEARWTAIEPSSNMQARLSRLPHPPLVVGSGWEAADVAAGAHDTVLAATMPTIMEQPGPFLARCRTWARRTVVWVVPAQRGPRGLCFAGCLPSNWHGEDETPGYEHTLRRLQAADHPHDMAFAEWTFTAVVPSLEKISAFLAARLEWPAHDPRRPQLLAHLAAQAKPHADGFMLDIARRSAVMIWRM